MKRVLIVLVAVAAMSWMSATASADHFRNSRSCFPSYGHGVYGQRYDAGYQRAPRYRSSRYTWQRNRGHHHHNHGGLHVHGRRFSFGIRF